MFLKRKLGPIEKGHCFCFQTGNTFFWEYGNIYLQIRPCAQTAVVLLRFKLRLSLLDEVWEMKNGRNRDGVTSN